MKQKLGVWFCGTLWMLFLIGTIVAFADGAMWGAFGGSAMLGVFSYGSFLEITK